MKTSVNLFGASLVLLTVIIEVAEPTCVLESDFGFKINCAFKKSGLFRVRNLGGVKAHASIGFSLGDELGFEQSLTNLDPSRRRSVSVKTGVAPNFVADTSAGPTAKQEKRGKQNRIMMRPMAPASRPNQAAMDRLASLHRRGTSTMKPIVVSGPAAEGPTTLSKVNPTVSIIKPLSTGTVPPFKPLPPKGELTLKVLPIPSATRKVYTPQQVSQNKGPGLHHQSENYPYMTYDQVSNMVSQMTASHAAQSLLRITPTPIIVQTPKLYSIPTTVNPFVPMPVASPPTQALTIISAPNLRDSSHTHLIPSSSPTHLYNSYSFQKTNPVSNFVDPVPNQVHDLASLYPVYNTKKVDDYNSITGYGDDTTLKFNKEDINAKIAEIAKAGNISMEAVEAAIALRQQQLLNKYANVPMPTTSTPAPTRTPTTTTTTSTEEPLLFQQEPEPEIIIATQKPKRNPTSGKVMNAPTEYYPVGYEKNFDDHFQSKVDLPDTNFHCGDQKYFPGLYGDESLGCMVFHVCALTDDGLVMKSFLCPESTLFDQTILKCNWWFYVDCKNTRRLYDTNIPVSKSYQLMKALTFFSSYKKEMQDDGQATNPEDVEGIKEAISILENQDTKSAQTGDSASALRIITPQPYVDERSKHDINESSPVYRGNRNYNSNNNSTSKKILARVPKPTQRPEANFVTKSTEDSNKSTKSSEISSSSTYTENTEKKHRRRMKLRSNSLNSTTTEATTPMEALASQKVENVIKPEVKQYKLTDQIDLDPSSSESSPPIKRFYRSSAENFNVKDDKEMAIVNEKVQIVRPTSLARLVGEYGTPVVTIAKLDEAVLGPSKSTQLSQQSDSLVTPLFHETIRSPTNRLQT